MPVAQLTIIVSPLLLHFVATLSARLMAKISVVERTEMERASLTNTGAASAERQLSEV
jgi:hypothetical protein